MKKRMYKIMALAMTAAMVVPMAAQTTAFAADDKEITYWNIAVESPDKDIVILLHTLDGKGGENISSNIIFRP